MTIDRERISADIDSEIKMACKNMFRSLIGCYPQSLSMKCSMDWYIKGLIAKAPNNEKLVSSLILMRENYISSLPVIKNLPNIGKTDMKKMVDLIPTNAILSPSDKNLGACLLPPSWYEKEYESQIEKGGYELQDMDENQCISLLLSQITKFRAGLSREQTIMLMEKWPKGFQVEPKIGILKLVPKIHKLSGPINSESWLELKSRPIRGSENDPMNTPSKALYRFLQELLSGFRQTFPALNASDQTNNFSVLSGCEDYLERLSKLQLDKEEHSRTFLISADFSDAFTQTQIPKLQESVSVIGHVLKYQKQTIDVINGLIELVFNNCYFSTPTGLYRQTHGMPMGDYSSRDGLDCVLAASEYEIIFLANLMPLKIHLFTRLVDDISLVLQGDFKDVETLLCSMAERYPLMPLNVQVSFSYSRFLDLHIFNMYPKSEQNQKYSLETTLAYKENSVFSYTPQTSNVHGKYKCSVVPISLHRAHTRCTDDRDINHHIHFMKAIVGARNQDPLTVQKKCEKFFQKRRSGGQKDMKESKKKLYTTPVIFDRVSGEHKVVFKLIRESFKNEVQVVFKSRNKVGSVLCPKRRTISKLSKILQK